MPSARSLPAGAVMLRAPITITRRQHSDLTAAGRIFEWFAAFEMLAFGVTLVMPDGTFSSSRAWEGFIRFGLSEAFVGAPAIVVGLIWGAALYINGSWRRSPLLRCGCALLGGSFWGAISGSFAAAHFIYGQPLSTAIGTYGLLCTFTFFAARRAAYDAILAGR